jgi:hypothetical protein
MNLKHKISLIILAFSVLGIYSCINSPDYSDTPTLEFVSLSNLQMSQRPLNSDTTIVSLKFTDGDGDIGFSTDIPGENIFIIDDRTGEFYDRFRVPAIPEQGANNGVSGTINMVVLNTCCIFPPQDSIPACESPMQYPDNDLTFTIYMVDRAGNKSNEVKTPVIKLKCN